MTIHPITKASQLGRNKLKAGRRAQKQAEKAYVKKATQRVRGEITAKDREMITGRDQNICQLCLKPCTKDDPPVIDHIIPIAQGGKSREENLATLHASCNHAKGASKRNTLLILKNIGHAIDPKALEAVTKETSK